MSNPSEFVKVDEEIPSGIEVVNDVTAAEVVDTYAEKMLVRKLDAYLIPQVMLLYLLSFLDRVNIGNARLV